MQITLLSVPTAQHSTMVQILRSLCHDVCGLWVCT